MACGVRDRQARDGQADHRGEQHYPPLDMRPQEQAEPPDPGADRDSDQPDRQRPQESGGRGRTDVREAGNRQRERAEPGPGVQADEDERSDARGQQARYQHELHHGAAQAGGFHQQERAGQGRAEQGADRGETPRRGHHGLDSGRSVPLDQANREGAEPGAEGDQRPFRPEHHAQAQGGQGREHDAGKLDQGRRASARLEPVGRRMAARAGQVPDGQRNQHPGQRQRQNGPPQRFGVKAQLLGQAGEDPALQLADQREEEVGRRRDGNADDRGQYQQHQVAPGPQQRKGIGRCRHERPPS